MKLARPKVPPQIVGNAGLFYVCHKLSALGWNAMPTSRNARGVDVMCFSIDGKKKLLLQVKSLSKRQPLILGSDLKKLMGDYWVIVTKAISDKPNCYILLPDQVRRLSNKGTMSGKANNWLRADKYDTDEFRERWELIGPGC